jgi:hypothetical protein
MNKIFARRRICYRRKIKIVASTLTNDALLWWKNLHDYEKPQTWTDVKSLMREQFVSMDDTKNNLSDSTKVIPSDKSGLPLCYKRIVLLFLLIKKSFVMIILLFLCHN